MNRNSKIEDLIIKYFNNELLDEEANALLQYLQTDDDAIKLFRQYAQLNQTLNHISRATFNRTKSFQKIKSAIEGTHSFEDKKSIKIIPIIAWLSTAAAAILILFATGYYFYATTEQVVQTGKNNVQTCKLPDGSIVTLNINSKLIYPRKFITNTRKVYLKGEAYFEVSSNKKKPFIVETKFINVNVIGTRFNIYEDTFLNGIIVVVDEGQVKVSKKTESQYIQLKKGGAALFDSISNNLTFYKNISINYLSWKTGILLFQETPLNEVVNDLSRHYHVTIKIENSELNNCKLDAKIIDYKIEEVFQMLETVFDINIKKENNIYIISGSGC